MVYLAAAKSACVARPLSAAARAAQQMGLIARIARCGGTSWMLNRAATQPGVVSAGPPPSGSNGSGSASKSGGSIIIANTTTTTTANSSNGSGSASKSGGSIIIANTTTTTTANSSNGRSSGGGSGGASRSRSTSNESGKGGRAAAVAACDTFECLRKAHALPPAQQERFNFPHALILGYPKCATTSLWHYLDQHPQALASHPKEPHYFTRCYSTPTPPSRQGAAWGCDQTQGDYLRGVLHRDKAAASGLSRAAFEASTGYLEAPAIAPGLRRALPWLKLVVSLREPISQAISLRAHAAEIMARPGAHPKWFAAQEGDVCLRRLVADRATMGECALEVVRARESYVDSLRQWLAAGWDRRQLHVMQYETFTSAGPRARAALDDLKRFLGLDPSLGPAQLPAFNMRRDHVHPEGWQISKRDYLALLAIVQPQSIKLANELERLGFCRAAEWLAPWAAAWRRTLEGCTPANCTVVLTR
ncbi:hypothetical protein Rsub_13332 [Raphidocelis subcapitata]|uniref:Sulfotransferase n=1 Tax=Raphidocelis subcapitata TaxID=307507 RepID=A0A2V0PL65_9CHLO|nr:hypothetical protein Rsub_13332 [Raphidocelis subcapitata]|eukprot:GBG00545.1 hypothetical protein Rsub_13332 [Raphidocelis subcapitata]